MSEIKHVWMEEYQRLQDQFDNLQDITYPPYLNADDDFLMMEDVSEAQLVYDISVLASEAKVNLKYLVSPPLALEQLERVYVNLLKDEKSESYLNYMEIEYTILKHDIENDLELCECGNIDHSELFHIFKLHEEVKAHVSIDRMQHLRSRIKIENEKLLERLDVSISYFERRERLKVKVDGSCVKLEKMSKEFLKQEEEAHILDTCKMEAKMRREELEETRKKYQIELVDTQQRRLFRNLMRELGEWWLSERARKDQEEKEKWEKLRMNKIKMKLEVVKRMKDDFDRIDIETKVKLQETERERLKREISQAKRRVEYRQRAHTDHSTELKHRLKRKQDEKEKRLGRLMDTLRAKGPKVETSFERMISSTLSHTLRLNAEKEGKEMMWKVYGYESEWIEKDKRVQVFNELSRRNLLNPFSLSLINTKIPASTQPRKDMKHVNLFE